MRDLLGHSKIVCFVFLGLFFVLGCGCNVPPSGGKGGAGWVLCFESPVLKSQPQPKSIVSYRINNTV